MNTPLSQCHASLGATQYSAACQTHIRCTLNWTPADRQGGRQRRSEEGWRVGGKKRKDGGTDYVREGASRSGGWGRVEEGG